MMPTPLETPRSQQPPPHSRRAVAIIPARGGSKGLPRKNILSLGGIPLIAWTIRAAKSARLIDRVIVSTDDAEIAAVAKEWGAEVPFMRPAAISGDRARLGDVTAHALKKLAEEGDHPDVAATLYPTHPFRPAGLIDRLVQKNMEGYGVVVPVARIDAGAGTYISGNNFLGAAEEPVYRQYGLYDGICVSFTGAGVWYEEIQNPIHLMDIDTKADLALANAIVEEKLFALPEGGR